MSDKETLFSAKNRGLLLGPLSKNNPVLVQILGICSALAVTAKLEPAIVMALSVTAVTAFSNVILSLLRNTYHRATGRGCRFGNHGGPNTEGVRIRGK